MRVPRPLATALEQSALQRGPGAESLVRGHGQGRSPSKAERLVPLSSRPICAEICSLQNKKCVYDTVPLKKRKDIRCLQFYT